MAKIGAQTDQTVARTEAPTQKPVLVELLEPRASLTSVLRPGTCFASRALTSSTSNPRASRISNTGIQYTPVDSIATVVMPTAWSHSVNWCRSPLKVRKVRTGRSSRHGHDVKRRTDVNASCIGGIVDSCPEDRR